MTSARVIPILSEDTVRTSTTYCRALARLTLGLLTLVLLGSLSACKMPFSGQGAPVAPAKPVVAPGTCVALALPRCV